jgi:hypothetical protein
MVTKYDYVSTCCNTDYSETRDESNPQVYTICVQCGQGKYTLKGSVVVGESANQSAPNTEE